MAHVYEVVFLNKTLMPRALIYLYIQLFSEGRNTVLILENTTRVTTELIQILVVSSSDFFLATVLHL